MKTSNSNQPGLFFSRTWDFLSEYLPKQEGRSPATVESYRDSLTMFKRYLAENQRQSISTFKFSDCTKDCVYGFREYLKQSGNKPATINLRVNAVRTYLYYAADRDVSIQSVALSISQIKPCKKVQEEKLVLSEDALAAILSAPPQTKMGLRDRAILVTLYDCAMRLNELLTIKLNDVTLDAEFPCILLHGKGNKERRTQLTEKSVGHLKEYLRIFHPDPQRDAYLFFTTVHGKPGKMSSGNVQRLLKQYTDTARRAYPDMPESVHPHMLRRTRATNLYQDGVALELVSTILGHARLETTRIYAQPSLGQIRDAMESVPTPVDDGEPLWVGNEDEMARRCGLR